MVPSTINHAVIFSDQWSLLISHCHTHIAITAITIYQLHSLTILLQLKLPPTPGTNIPIFLMSQTTRINDDGKWKSSASSSPKVVTLNEDFLPTSRWLGEHYHQKKHIINWIKWKPFLQALYFSHKIVQKYKKCIIIYK